MDDTSSQHDPVQAAVLDVLDVILRDPEIRLLKVLPDVDDGDCLPRITEIFAETARRHGLPQETLAVAYLDADPQLRSRIAQPPSFPRKRGLRDRIVARLTGRRPLMEILDPAKVRHLHRAAYDLCHGDLIREIQAVAFNSETDYHRGRITTGDLVRVLVRQLWRAWRAGQSTDPHIALIWCDHTQSWWKTGPGDRTTSREEARRWRLGAAMFAGFQSRRLGTTKIEIFHDGRRWRISAFIAALMHEEPLL